MMTNAQLIQTLQRHNVRPSVHRIAVLEYVVNHGTHPTADEVYSAVAADFPSVSRTTVYNSLHTLVDAGLLRELDMESSNMRYDMTLQMPHSHFRCTRCGKIYDMELPAGLERMVKPGFIVNITDLHFSGLCPDCAGKSSDNPNQAHINFNTDKK